jgi:RNA polymerase sigma-70 factor (ECF subfamily)
MAVTPIAASLDDTALVDAMTRGDAAAMSPLYDRYAAGLLGLALRITRERADAEEVVVDTFAQAWRDAANFQPGRGSVASWLATIARSRALDLMRSRARRVRLGDAAASEAEVEPAGMGSSFPSPVADVLADERSRHVQQALGNLPESQRTALELAYFQGLSQTEIADQLQEPLGTVKTRMRLGLRKLRELLAPLGPGGLT